MKTTDRNGRKIKNSRYMTTLYGVECAVELKCAADNCDARVEFTCSNNEAASSFDELT